MNKKELRKLAVQNLNTTEVQDIKKRVCKPFIGREQQKCMKEFDKNFVRSFIQTAEYNLK
jgi:hypothetical protein